jgi:mono/diheme cytochrome c family protein
MTKQGSVRKLLPIWTVLLLALGLAAPPLHAQGGGSGNDPSSASGEVLFRNACAACHGANGAGADPSKVGFDTPLPDFTSCDFATREPDADWIAIAHEGGPVRGFSAMMPAFGDALSEEELQRVMGYIRTLCHDDDWPRGELNLPRAQLTEKAYPEDEAVWSTSVATGERGAVMNELVYEQRFGARNQFEIAVPFGFQERADGGWTGAGIGDVALGVKRAVYHDLGAGSIFSVAGEVVLPTGDEETGFGKGTPIAESFLAFGQILPRDAFLQMQGGLEYPFDRDRATEEAFWRGVLGMSVTEGSFGRTWTPMLEVAAARELESGAGTEWDIVPQAQVTLNTRQHLMASVGLRIPLNETEDREPELLFYLLWDWFDGGLLDGW